MQKKKKTKKQKNKKTIQHKETTEIHILTLFQATFCDLGVFF